MRYKVVLIAAIFLPACATAPMDVSKFSSARKTTDIALITLNAKDFDRVDLHYLVTGATKPLFGSEKNNSVATGKLWKQVFIGDPSGNASITIDNAALYDSLEGIGFVMRETYKVDAILSYCNQQFPIHAEGTRAAAMAVPTAIREAVEQGIANTAAKAKSIITQCK